MAIKVIFEEGITKAYAESAYQHDKNQTLIFEGIEIPENGEVHFSNDRETGISIAVKAKDQTALIPDVFLENGEYVYAWVHARSISGGSEKKMEYHVEEEEDDLVIDSVTGKTMTVETAKTLYQVTIPVIRRPGVFRLPDESGEEQDESSLLEHYEIFGENLILKE